MGCSGSRAKGTGRKKGKGGGGRGRGRKVRQRGEEGNTHYKQVCTHAARQAGREAGMRACRQPNKQIVYVVKCMSIVYYQCTSSLLAVY